MKQLALALITAGLVLPGSPTAQNPGLTPEQVMQMRAVLAAYPSPDGESVAFLRRVPRPAADGPGAAYLHLVLLERTGMDRKPTERLLIGGKSSTHGVSWDPQTERITLVKVGEGSTHAEVHALSADGKSTERITETPLGVESYGWSPDGNHIAYTVTDPMPEGRAAAQKMGFGQRIVDEDYRQVGLWIWDRKTGESRRITEGRSVFGFAWTPDSKRLAAGIAPHNLVDDQYMFVRLHEVDATTGAVEPLVDNPGKLGQYAWSPRGDRLAYISAADRRDPHAGTLYVVGTDREPRCLTPDFEGMVHHVHWGTLNRGKEMITAVISRGVRNRVLIIDPDTGEHVREITVGDGNVAFSSMHGDWGKLGGRYFVGSTAGHPDELFAAGFGPGYTRLTDSNPWLKDVTLGKQETVQWKARDGVQIEGLLLYPVGYRAGERYPLVVVAHGGPESHYNNGWNTSYSSWGQMLCARGYFAWYPNYRASTGYGVAFAKADHGDPMGSEFEDHLDAIRHFAERGLIDRDRVALGGGSYGGYTAAWAATRHSGHFAAAVSFVPFVDIRTKWYTSDIPYEFYYVHYQEKWPHEQRGFLADRSPLSYAEHCRTPLLVLGGTSDPRVHPSQPFMLYRAVKFATETPVRYVQYPGEGHGNRMNVYRYDYALRTLRWFDHYLQPGDHRRDRPPQFDLDYSAWTGSGAR